MPITPEVRIPASSIAAVQHLLRTAPESLGLIAKFVGTAPAVSDIEGLASQCSASVGLPAETIETTLTLAINIAQLRRRLDLDAANALDVVANSLAQSGNWSKEDAVAFRERMPALEMLAAPDTAVDAMSKARELLYEAQCVLFDSALITDSRWIYNTAGSEIRGCVIIHTLSLEYAEGSDRRQLHLILSENDVAALQRQLVRANEKAATARRLLDSMDLPELTPKVQPRS